MLRFDLHDGAYLREVRPDDVDELFAVAHANQAHAPIDEPNHDG